MSHQSTKRYWLILSLGIIALTLAQAIIPAMGDDPFFTAQPFSISWLIGRYQEWSSRIFIEGLLVLLSKQLWLFRLLNAGIFMLLIDTLAKTTLGRQLNSLLIIGACFLFLPVTLFLSAGWLATSLNYLWPISLAALVITSLDKRLTAAQLASLTLLTLFATNQEQVCLTVLLVLIGRLVTGYLSKTTINRSVWIILGITLFNAVLIALSPGNHSRQLQSIPALFPEFATFSFWDKVNLGMSNTSKILLVHQNLLVILLLAVVALLALFNSSKWWIKGISLIPLAVVPINVLLMTLSLNGYNVQTFSQYLLEKQASPALNQLMKLMASLLTNDVSIIWNVFFILIFICLSVALVAITKRYASAYLLMIGLASHAMMGFSPSIFKSGDRTAFILYFIIVYLLLLLCKELFLEKNQRVART